MERWDMEASIMHTPPLGRDFLPLGRWAQAYARTARQPFAMALERADGAAVTHTCIHGTPERREADIFHVERMVKTLLWTRGGFRLTLSGDRAVCDAIVRLYAPGGARAFDADFMAELYRRPFAVVCSDRLPPAFDTPRRIGGHFSGCRIGLDAGGSDRKAAALIDGQAVYREEVPWSPKTAADPAYHYEGIVSALRSAASHLPRVDAVGVSTAGICLSDRLLCSALFVQVPPAHFDKVGRDVYLRAVRDVFGPVPCAVVNDGDVSALAGSMALGETGVLGLAMGTSLAGGYVDGQGRITGWLNELAFVPVDANPAAAADSWSGDRGCGVSYFSQEAVLRLAARAGIGLPPALSPGEKLREVQNLLEAGDERAAAVFDTIGVYLGHTLPLYHALYGYRHLWLQGRVLSGVGGERILRRCRTVLAEEYPAFAAALHLPDEMTRRVGQAEAAASLPDIGP